MEIIKEATNKLAEHFEDVQIFACSKEDGGEGTSVFRFGTGNWYARYGMIKEWMIYQDEIARLKTRHDIESED